MKSPVSPVVRALLAGAVDYAGLFPPASLALEPTLNNHAVYLRGEEAWMLGCLVLPTGKMADAGDLLAGRFDPAHPLRVSALGPKPPPGVGFEEVLRAALDKTARFGQMHGDTVTVCQFEALMPPLAAGEVGGWLRQVSGLVTTLVPWPLQIFWEIPFSGDLPAVVEAFGRHNEAAAYSSQSRTFGIKLRTGGTEAVTFPSTKQLADALLAARDAGVALKFTAGLHHPVRHFSEGVGTHMHGFLNVYAAGILAREHGLGATETEAILTDERPKSFRFGAKEFGWCNRRVPITALAEHRQFITSFGSCSFDEPREDLRRFGLLA